MPERTPWWLLALRMLALAAAILAFAGPVLNPRPEGSDAPLLVLMDGGWGDAPDWARRMDRAAAALSEAGRSGRPAAVLTMATPPLADEAPPWRPAAEWAERLAGLAPQAWAPDRAAWAGWVAGQDGAFETLWLGDGIGHGGEAELARALLAHGPVTLVGPPRTALALTPPRLDGGDFKVGVLRAGDAGERPVGLMALGPDPNGIERVLGSATGELRRRRGRARPRHRHADGAAEPGGAGAARRGPLGGGGGAGGQLGAAAQGRADVGTAGRRGAGPGRSAALPAQGAGAVRRGDRGAAARDAERGAGRADPRRRRPSRRGGAGGAHPLGGEGRAAGPLRRAAARHLGGGAARGGSAAAGEAAGRRAVDRRGDVVGGAAAAPAVPGDAARSPGCRCRRTSTSRAR